MIQRTCSKEEVQTMKFIICEKVRIIEILNISML